MKAFLHTYRKALANHADVFAFGEGLKRHGWEVSSGEASEYRGSDLIVQWNVRHDALLLNSRGAETCILETSYLEPRRDYVSVSFGTAINNRNRFYGPFDDPSRWDERFAKALKPYPDETDGPVLIMGQMPGDMAVKPYVNFFDWVYDVYRHYKERYDVRFRPHPGMKLPVKPKAHKWAKVCVHPDEFDLWRGWERAIPDGLQMDMSRGLEDALAGARHVVTFNSNSGVDAVLAGRPAIAIDRGSMAWPVAGHKLDEVFAPDEASRLQWARALAWKQWTRDEIESGRAWEYVRPPHMR